MSAETSSPFLFVGRTSELAALRAGLEETFAGRGCLWLVAGEAGVGKTRLADELAREARARGAAVLWGRCWEDEGAPAFWPWVRIIRAYLGERDPRTVQADMGAGAADIAQLAGELRERLPMTPELPAADAERGRFRLFDSIATFLTNAAKREPIVVILDDLHWADQASLRLLRFVARELRTARLLIVGTYRTGEIVPQEPLGKALDAIAREGHRLELRGLSQTELATLIEGSRGREPSAAWVRAIHRLTEGNPFFAKEILSGLAHESAAPPEGLVGIPASVRHAIGRRCERLSAACRGLLAVAAVIGREFEVHVLAAVLRSLGGLGPGSNPLLLIDEAATAMIIAPTAAGADQYAFSHALIRETLYDELGSSERSDLHRRVAESILARPGGARESDLTELAHHYSLATAGGDIEPAIEYATKAAERAARLLAFEDAAAHYQVALDALRLRHAPTVELRNETDVLRSKLLIAFADNLMRAGERPKAKAAYLEVAHLARTTRQPRVLARAALGFSGLGDATPSLDSQVVAFLEEALAGLGTESSGLRARVLSRLSEVLYFSSAHERKAALSEEAVTLAEQLGDTATLGYALNARHFALWRPQNLAERRAVADRIVDLAARAGDRELALAGHSWRIIDLLELGDMAAVDAEIEVFGTLAAALRQAFNLWQLTSLRAMRALMDGRLEEGERLVQEASTLGQRAQSPNAAFRFGVQFTLLRRLQGRFHELEGLIKASADRYPGIAAFRVALALLYSEAERHDEARALFEVLAANDFAAVPEDATWISAMCHLAEVCAALTDEQRAAQLYARLLPYADRNVVISFAHGSEGAVARHLGLLATITARFDAAARHFEDALAVNRRMGARPFVAHTQRDYAAMLLRRGAPEDEAKAAELAREASATYAALGMSAHAARARRLSGTSSPAPATAQANAFRRRGDYWTLCFEAKTIQLRDLKGLHYLTELLRYPYREIHVVDLAQAVDAAPVERGHRQARAAPAQPTPDAGARSAYRLRLQELREELDEAERFNDSERASNARRELELLTAELSRSYGMGAARRDNEPVERARKAVANRIRLVLVRLRREHPALARHFSLTVRIGTFCSYRPEHPPAWELG